MAYGNYCNLRCFTYFVATFTIAGGVLQLITFDVLTLMGGLFNTGLGALLFYGTRMKNRQYVLGFVITEGVVLITTGVIWCVVGLNVTNKPDIDDHQKEELSTISFTVIGAKVFTFLLLIPVFLYYKQLVRKNNQLPAAQEYKI